MDQLELWEYILEACDAELKGKATSNQKEVLVKWPDLHLGALKAKKQEIECQFTSHKAIMQEYHQDYVAGNTNKIIYFESIAEEKMWKAKAVSYLTRIEVKIIELNSKICMININETIF